MRSVRQMALRVIQIVGKAIVARAYAVGPISRKQEAELRAFLAANPGVWGNRSRATD